MNMMEAEEKSMIGKAEQSSALQQFLKKHGELTAAIVSGILIGFGFLFDTIAPYLFTLAFVIGGYAKAKEGLEDLFIDKKLNVEILMILAAIGSGIIGHWGEGAILIFIFSLSGAMETYTLNKSEDELSSLMALQPEEATLLIDGQEKVISAKELKQGDYVLVRPGERVPADGKVIKGQSAIDESAITGESIPNQKELGSDVYSGTVNVNGALTIEVEKETSDTLFQKIIELVHSAKSEKSPSQLFIERFEGTYVKAVLLITALMMFIPHYAFGWTWEETFYRAMVLLVVASPCALVASIMPATLSAISNGAKHGTLFKGGVHLERLGSVKAIAFDKTGTITNGEPRVTDVYVRENMSKQDFLTVVASVENHSAHPLAQAIVRHAKLENIPFTEPDQLEDVSGWGVKATFNGDEWLIGKKAFVGEDEADHFLHETATDLEHEGKTIIFVRDHHGIAGMIALKDSVREEAKAAIQQLNNAGIHTIMITGDGEKTAQAIAKETGIEDYYAECLPETKLDKIKELQQKYGAVAMVGDGINDAPALATADVGIAMGAGTDVALETAEIVLMKNKLQRIADAMNLSRKMNRIVKQNIIFSISVILLLIAANFSQVLTLPLGVVGHEGSTILVILNGLRLLKS